MKQIKIENNGVEQLITVPENSKVTIDGNVVVFEPKFKKGDCVIGKGSYHPKMAKFVEFIKDECGCQYDNNSNGCHFRYLRLATIEEKNETLSYLKTEGKQWNEEKLCIEGLKVVPKVGDCVKLYIKDKYIAYFVCKENCKFTPKKSFLCNVLENGYTVTKTNLELNYNGNCEYDIQKKEQFQSELAQLGFEYNFENDTISELKWKPKDGEIYWHITVEFEPARQSNDNVSYDLTRINALNCFKTKELCQQAIDKIKQVLSEK